VDWAPNGENVAVGARSGTVPDSPVDEGTGWATVSPNEWCFLKRATTDLNVSKSITEVGEVEEGGRSIDRSCQDRVVVIGSKPTCAVFSLTGHDTRIECPRKVIKSESTDTCEVVFFCSRIALSGETGIRNVGC
jgi:hypothetical protein